MNLPLQIRFETAAHIPPPFSHQYSLGLSKNAEGKIEADFKLAYTSRETLELIEIFDEGFSENDDFEWQGEINANWTSRIEQKIQELKIELNQKSEENLFEIKQNDDSDWIVPENQETLEYFFRELYQGFYEKDEREMPFSLTLINVDSASKKQVIELNASFYSREYKVIINSKSERLLDWDSFEKDVKLIYAGEYLTEQATKKNPIREGLYISIGDGYWYEMGKSLQKPSGNKNYYKQLAELYDSFLM